jgi:hypothetical protein
MLHLVVFLLFFFILLPYLLSTKEPLREEVIPISFPQNNVVQLPSQMDFPRERNYNRYGPRYTMKGLDVQGPVLLGIAGGGEDLTYIEANKDQLVFNSAGYDQSSDAVLYTNDGLAIQAGSTTLDSTVQSGPVQANKANVTFLHVNRPDGSRYPDWQSGVHTTDLYANGTVGAGRDGQVAASIASNGFIQAAVLDAPSVVGDSVECKMNNKDVNFLVEVDELKKKVKDLNEQIRVRNERREAERRAAEAAAAAARNRGRRRGCSVM